MNEAIRAIIKTGLSLDEDMIENLIRNAIYDAEHDDNKELVKALREGYGRQISSIFPA